MQTHMMEFSEKPQQLRKQKGLTQEALARTLYISRPAISKWESDAAIPCQWDDEALTAELTLHTALSITVTGEATIASWTADSRGIPLLNTPD